ncbi:MAG: hypothetical protein Q8N77_00690 [Nanoarchaeota archaeon]|nr:hypothetical protein [Nanoarchaeota archaeon]
MVDQRLLDSIKKYLDQGVSIDSVRQSLLQSGWSEKDIKSALEKITGQKVAEEKKLEEVKPSESKRKLLFITGGIIVVLILAVSAYLFFFKVGFSEDIPPDFVPFGNLNNFMKDRMIGYNPLALDAVSPLKDVIQDGRVNLIMTDNLGKKIIDCVGVVIENSQIVSVSVKVDNPSLDVKFTEKAFDKLVTASEPKSSFLAAYAKSDVKIKAYGSNNENRLGLLGDFVQYFFVF